jgi:hypothetical protein
VFQDFGRDVIARSTGEIGMHLHAWNSPPIVPLTADDFKFAPYLIEFPVNVMREKIKVMTFCLEDVFGVKTLTHRAGRWAFDEIYARLLAEFGYESDCSVTPHVSWRSAMGNPGGNGGSDYSDFPEQPFVIDLGESGGIFEVPTTIFPKPIAFFERVARKALGKPTRQWWLRPTGKNLREMLHVLDMGVSCGRDYVQFMLHSSEFMPGGSPTFDTADKIERLYAHLEGLFATAASHFIGATLSEYVATRKADVGTAIPLRPWPKPAGGRPIPGTGQKRPILR